MAEQITATCPDCGSPQGIPEEWEGRLARCAACNAIYRVPGGVAELTDTQESRPFADAARTEVEVASVECWVQHEGTSAPIYLGPEYAQPSAENVANDRSMRRLLLIALIVLFLLLAAIIWPAWYGGTIPDGGLHRISSEVARMDMAVEAYKRRYGEYPPDFSDWELVESHLRKVFPRHSENLDPSLQVGDDGAKLGDIDAAEALVFWLSRLRNDPRHPVTGSGEPLVSFEFDELRLWDFDGDGWWEYVPEGASSQETPYVYFDSRTYDKTRYPKDKAESSIQGVAYPYRTAAFLANVDTRAVMNPNTFQIISAGLDGDYGADNPVKLFPRGAGYGPGDWDNVTNFSNGKTLKHWATR